MKNVEVVNLSINRISSLAAFAQCKSLKELYIRKNNIASLTDIYHLRALPNLRVLWLADNPCAIGDEYRKTVLGIIPNLVKLDNTSVTEEERCGAQQQEEVNGRASSPEEEEEEEEGKDLLETRGKTAREKRRERLSLAQVKDPVSSAVATNAGKGNNVLTAVLCLLRELDGDSLQMVVSAASDRLETLAPPCHETAKLHATMTPSPPKSESSQRESPVSERSADSERSRSVGSASSRSEAGLQIESS
ncbi:PREDICTED: protein C21orf2-like [Priapulus caudatus]|uniref:Protein C21orf2-like n=1 Tax=Priapulus caudatus TaxID=37621 RepID=A0ABM1EPY1_PRICU|nr:PREDICTED: protein C21orf2-like [Priapulus caudatus]